jgi:hypothetical protein
MIIMMPEHKVKRTAKRLQKVLDGLGIEFRYTACLELSAQLHGFENWYQYLRRDLTAPFSPFDEQLSEAAFAVRDEFQVAVLDKAGLGPVARELLDRVNPTGSWAKNAPAKKPVWEAIAGNDPL